MGFKRNDPNCIVADFSGAILSGIAYDTEDEPIRILPINEEDEVTVTQGCASINVKDRSAVYVEIDFSACSGSLAAIRQSKEFLAGQPTTGDQYLAIDDVCSGESFFSNCVYPLTNLAQGFGNAPGIKTVRFVALNPVRNDAQFTI